jgi:regulator of sirC expression with transglutaminase-like and TPR domain
MSLREMTNAEGSLPARARRPETFEELAAQADAEIDVLVGAAIIAKDAYPALDVAALVARVEDLAGPLADKDLSREPLLVQVETVSERFRELGFLGNAEDYYDARNSLLPDVLDRKLGIPISLAIVWSALAARAGVRARGVTFPGHFVVRVDGAPAAESSRAFVLVDAFDGGRVLDGPGQAALLRRTLGAGAELHPSLLAPASPRAVLVRLLSNLKAIYASRGDHGRAFVAIDRILSLSPDAPRMLRERAGVSVRLGAHQIARADLARVLELEPEAPDAGSLRAQLAALGGATETPRVLH